MTLLGHILFLFLYAVYTNTHIHVGIIALI